MTLSRSTMFLVSLINHKLLSYRKSGNILLKLWMVVSQVMAQRGENFKIESCRIEIMNSASGIVKLEHKPIHDQLLIEQNSDLTHIQRRPSTERFV